jgi:predicted pyridoxine 5'-phosphate oxidase superfamily flavin-nucleotide-binding protein
MVELTKEMTDSFGVVKYFPLATASSDGEPNVAPMGAVFLIDPGTIWIGDQFMKTTIRNIRENPRASLYAWGPGIKGCFKIKGDVTVLTSGPDYEKMKEMVKEKNPNLHCRSLLVLKVTDVYDCLPGPEAGKKII